MNLPRFRKAVAAFVASILTLPIAAWILGEEPFSWTVLATAAGVAATNALGVYLSPRNQAA